MANGDLIIGDDGWTEIVGEQLRGGSTVAGLSPKDAYDVLGEAINKSPAFAAYVAKRAAASRPVLHKTPFNKARDWQIDFPTNGFGAFGLTGTQCTMTATPQVHFRGEKVMATDTGSTAGMGTMVSQLFVGQEAQRPSNQGATLTAFFAQNALGNGIKWDTCQRALTIALTVLYLQDCTFFCTVFGKSVK